MTKRLVATPEAMADLGAALAAGLAALPATAGVVIHLRGDLGAGKTTLVRGVLRALGHAGRVKSPTYTLIEGYPVGDPAVGRELHHLDLYRLASPDEVRPLGLRDLPSADWLLVEWPEKGEGALPAADLEVHLEHVAEGSETPGRWVGFEARSETGRRLVDKLGA